MILKSICSQQIDIVIRIVYHTDQYCQYGTKFGCKEGCMRIEESGVSYKKTLNWILKQTNIVPEYRENLEGHFKHDKYIQSQDVRKSYRGHRHLSH